MVDISKRILCELRQISQQADQMQGQTLINTKLKLDRFDDTTSWLDFKFHFDVCAGKRKACVVPLRGQAQASRWRQM